MKIIKSTIATLLLSAAAATMFIGCDKTTKPTNDNDADSLHSVVEKKTETNGLIVYVQMDSLMAQYDMYTDLSHEFEKKAKSADADLTYRGRALEREIAEYQETAQKGLLTRSQMQTKEEELMKKQQAAMDYRERVMTNLQEQELVLTNRIAEELVAFLSEYNKDKGYAMILQTTGRNPIMIADPALNITEEVVALLNTRYQESLKNATTDAAKK